MNHIPVTQWPSIESYDAFKRYFLAAYTLIQLRLGNAYQEQRKKDFAGTYEALQKALAAARK